MVLVKNIENSTRKYFNRRVGNIINFKPGEEIELQNFIPQSGFIIVEKLPEKNKAPKVQLKKEIIEEEE